MAKAGVRVTVDRVAEFNGAVKLLREEAVYVGVAQDGDGRKDGKGFGNAAIGYVSENGSAAAHIPPRPHLVPGVNAVRAQVADELGAGARALLNGRPDAVRTSYVRAGLIAQQSVQRVISTQEGFRPLAPSTLERRKNRKKAPRQGELALIDTGEYRQSIKYHIRKRNK